MKILINHKQGSPFHATDWAKKWIDYCERENIEHIVTDLLSVYDPIKLLREVDIVLWHFDNYNFEEMLQARNLLRIAENMGIKTFPNTNESWHFDDKVAETYALQAVNAPIPQSSIYYSYEAVKSAINSNTIIFPIVAKLRTGSGSHNVKLIKSSSQLRRYARRMFGRGFNPAPSIIYKTSSNIRSSHDWETFVKKFKRIPEFLRTLKGAKKFPKEKGYVYLQEFLPNDNYDMKVVIVGDKCTGFYRPVRSHDFRASGGGAFVDDASTLTEQIVKSAFMVADKLNVRCIGFDLSLTIAQGKEKLSK